MPSPLLCQVKAGSPVVNRLRLWELRPDPGQLRDAVGDAHRLGLGKRAGAADSRTGGATGLIGRQQHISRPGPHTVGGLWLEVITRAYGKG